DCPCTEPHPPPPAGAPPPRREPQRVNGDGHRIIERCRHGEASEPMTLRRRAVCEHGDLTRCVIEAREFQPRIERSTIRLLLVQRILIAGLEAVADRGTARLILNDHETPWLTQAHRG